MLEEAWFTSNHFAKVKNMSNNHSRNSKGDTKWQNNWISLFNLKSIIGQKLGIEENKMLKSAMTFHKHLNNLIWH